MGLTNGIGSDGRTSPTSSLGSMNDGVGSHAEENNRHSDGYHQSLKDSSGNCIVIVLFYVILGKKLSSFQANMEEVTFLPQKMK